MSSIGDILRDGEPIVLGDFRQWLGALKGRVDSSQTVLATATILALVDDRVFADRDALDADLDHAAGLFAFVVTDSDPLNNDLYKKSGASGSGSWGEPLGLISGAAVAATDPLFAAVEDTLAGLQAQIDVLGYAPPNITSFTSTVVQAEVGATVNALDLAWAITGASPTAQTLTWTGGGSASLVAGDRAKSLTGLARTTDTTFTLTATDGDAPAGVASDQDVATVVLAFLRKSHIGWIDEASGATLSSADVLGFDHSWFEDGTSRSISFTNDAAGYLWFSQLASLADPAFKIDGIAVAPTRTTRSHTNTSGSAATYADFRLSGRLSSGASGLLEIIR
jgi:hypothetical protein